MSGVLLRVERPALAAALIARGVPLWRNGTPDVVVIPVDDWRRAPPAIPALVLTGDEAEAASAIDEGAADAVPHRTADILIAARLAAWLRQPPLPSVVRLGGLEIDTVARSAIRDGQPLKLLPREYALLLYLARNAGRIVSRDELLERIWRLGFDPGTNVVQVHISRLRARLDRGRVPMLLTETGRGYRLVAPDPAPV
jgi:two-component system, OmpR family, response regulator